MHNKHSHHNYGEGIKFQWLEHPCRRNGRYLIKPHPHSEIGASVVGVNAAQPITNGDKRDKNLATRPPPGLPEWRGFLARESTQPTDWAGAENCNCKACRPHQSHKGSALHTGKREYEPIYRDRRQRVDGDRQHAYSRSRGSYPDTPIHLVHSSFLTTCSLSSLSRGDRFGA